MSAFEYGFAMRQVETLNSQLLLEIEDSIECVTYSRPRHHLTRCCLHLKNGAVADGLCIDLFGDGEGKKAARQLAIQELMKYQRYMMLEKLYRDQIAEGQNATD